VFAAVGDSVERFRKGMLEKQPARLELNNALKGFSQIEWWGTRVELFSQDSEFPRHVRSGFRGDDDESQSSDSPITIGEEEDFLDYLETYGC
jgi:hypothetical protein